MGGIYYRTRTTSLATFSSIRLNKFITSEVLHLNRKKNKNKNKIQMQRLHPKEECVFIVPEPFL